MDEAYFVFYIDPNFHISLIYDFVVGKTKDILIVLNFKNKCWHDSEYKQIIAVDLTKLVSIN